MKGFVLAEQGHVVNIIPPIDLNAAAVTSDYFSLAEYGHLSIVINLGVVGAATTFTVFESDDNAGSSETAIGFSYYEEQTVAGDTFSTRTSATASGFATHASNNSQTFIIELDASELTEGFPYLALKATDPGATTIGGAIAVLSGSRYGQEITPTALT